MTASDDDRGDSTCANKRQAQRACDVCRRRKMRCDGPDMSDKRCSICLAGRLQCTYDQGSTPRAPTKAYVNELEQRVKKLEGMLEEKRSQDGSNNALANPVAFSEPSSSLLPSAPPPTLFAPSQSSEQGEGPDPNDNEAQIPGLTQWLEQLKIDPATPRFHNESNSYRAVMEVVGIKHNFSGQPSGNEPWSDMTLNGGALTQREEFWRTQPWEKQTLKTPEAFDCDQYDFPPDDLLLTLVDKYYSEIDILLSLLYRPAFDKGVRERLYLRDQGFACVLLLVCAIGSTFVDDPRVLIDGAPLSSGWKYFNQVQLVRKSLFAPPQLYDLQICCLGCHFLSCSSLPQALWSLVGMGARLVQDLGLHRKVVYSGKPNVQEEQWKRAFWVLASIDRFVSLGMGRPTALQSEDIDVDLPLEVDDEYWEHPDPSKAFVQPPGQPSKVTSFVMFIKLHHIMTYATRTIYSIRRSKRLLGLVGTEAEQKVVSQLDSALNLWADSIPDHLRWDPKREDMTFFYQSSNLWSTYYQLQIIVHRPFVSPTGDSSSMALSSLAMCMNAARVCARIIELQQDRKGGSSPVPIAAAFSSGMVLLINVCSKRPGLMLDPVKEMMDVNRCIYALKQSEKRWPIAGRFVDILTGIASTALSHIAVHQPADLNKRKHPGDDSFTRPDQGVLPGVAPTHSTSQQMPSSQRDGFSPGGISGSMGFRPILSLGTDGHDADPFAQAMDMSALFGGPPESAAGQLFDPEAPIGTWGLGSNPLPMDFLASLGDADLTNGPIELNGPLNSQPTYAPPAEAMSGVFSWPGIPSELQPEDWEAFLKAF